MPSGPVLDLMLNPAVRVLWRAEDVVQLELGARAVLVEGVDAATVRRLVSIGGRTGEPPDDPSDDATRHSLTALAEAGYLWPRSRPGTVGVGPGDDARLAPPAPRLAADLGALTARHGADAAELLNARRHCAVAVHGAGRVAAHVAALLAAAGIGRVQPVDGGDVRLHQAMPGGLGPGDEGRRFVAAASAAVQRAAPDAVTAPLAMGERPDLVVLAVDEPSTAIGETPCTPGTALTSWSGSAPTTVPSGHSSSPGSPAACVAPTCTVATATRRGTRWPSN